MIRPVSAIGNGVIQFFKKIVDVSAFMFQTIVNMFVPPFYWKECVKQMIEIGFYSFPIVGFTALFAGMVLALQTYVGFTRFNAENAIASVVVISITRELGPVFAGLMVAGRVSSAIAAEIASMKVSDQIDALITLRVNPYRFLVVPRIFAAIITLPILVFIADLIGVMGGFLVSTTMLNFPSGGYISQTLANLELMDVFSGLIKASFFGITIAFFGCYNGFHACCGAEGVGEATTSSVVASCIGILVLNYLLTALFFGV